MVDRSKHDTFADLTRESYHATERQTREIVTNEPGAAREAIETVFAEFNVPQELTEDLVMYLSKSSRLPEFLMRFQHTLAEPPSSRAIICALTIALAYFFGGLIPLLPYFFVADIDIALGWSIGTMAVALFLFGYCKTCFVNGWGRQYALKGIWGGVQMIIVGGAAAGSAMGLVKAFHAISDQYSS